MNLNPIQIQFSKHNEFMAGKLIQRNGILVDSLLREIIVRNQEHSANPLKFSLRIKSDFFQPCKNYNSLREGLERFKTGLETLHLEVPVDGASFYRDVLPLELPALQDLEITIRSPLDKTFPPFLKNRLSLADFLSSLLSSSVALNLKKLAVVCSKYSTQEMQNLGFKTVAKNKLPSLTSLTLQIPLNPVSDVLILQALENCCETLKELKLFGMNFMGSNFRPNIICFLKMHQLESLTFAGWNCQLDNNVEKISTQFPKLRKLFLLQTEHGFGLWTKGSRFHQVDTFELEVRNPDREYLGKVPLISFENMKLIKRAFPFVKDLTLTIPGTQCSDPNGIDSIRYMFKSMSLLTHLKLTVVDTESVMDSDAFDAILIGAALKQIPRLKTSPNTSFIENEFMPPINCLSELKSLTMDGRGVGPQMISYLSFVHGFLKMPALDDLNLFGRFKPTSTMEQMWTNRKQPTGSI